MLNSLFIIKNTTLKNLLFVTTVLLGLFISCSPYPNKTYKLYRKEYTAFTHNAAVDSIEKKYNVRLNSLEKIEKFGGDLSGKMYREFDSLHRLIMDENLKYEFRRKRYSLTNKIDSIIGIRIQEIANKQYDQKTGLLLTLGGDGHCGIEGKWYDDLTLKYCFKYNTILCSDNIFYENRMAKFYNYSAKKHLDSINGNDWEHKLENEILAKKRDIKIKTDIISVLTTKEYHIFNRQLLVFPKKVTKLKNLETLYVCDNFFTEVDVSLANLKKMKKLHLYSNKLNNFPNVVLELPQLEWLFLNYNEIDNIPETIATLDKLTTLDLSNNKLTDLPQSLSSITSLEFLDITENNFNDIPKVLYDMSFLEVLRIRCNKCKWKENEKIKKQLSLLKEALPNTKIY